jgi:hypothetical protein
LPLTLFRNSVGTIIDGAMAQTVKNLGCSKKIGANSAVLSICTFGQDVHISIIYEDIAL